MLETQAGILPVASQASTGHKSPAANLTRALLPAPPQEPWARPWHCFLSLLQLSYLCVPVRVRVHVCGTRN